MTELEILKQNYETAKSFYDKALEKIRKEKDAEILDIKLSREKLKDLIWGFEYRLRLERANTPEWITEIKNNL